MADLIKLHHLVINPTNGGVELRWPFWWRVKRHMFVLIVGWVLCGVATVFLMEFGQVMWVIGTAAVMPMLFLAATLPSIVKQMYAKHATITQTHTGIEMTESLYYNFETVLRFKRYFKKAKPNVPKTPGFHLVDVPDCVCLVMVKRKGDVVPILFESGPPEAVYMARAVLVSVFSATPGH